MPTYLADEADVFVNDVKVVGLGDRIEVELGGFHSISRSMSAGGGSVSIVHGDDHSRPIPARVRFKMRKQTVADELIGSWEEATRRGHGSTVSVFPHGPEPHKFEQMLMAKPELLGGRWEIEFEHVSSKINSW